jgi:hypothetical protein
MTGMEVRRRVIVEEHRDNDPEETTDGRHAEDLALPIGLHSGWRCIG